MANKSKHMERSHKTYSQNKAIFAGFEAKAMKLSAYKEAKKSNHEGAFMSLIAKAKSFRKKGEK